MFPAMTDGEADASNAEANAAPTLPDFIDASHPDAAAATPIVQELGLDRDKTAKLVLLHETMSKAAIERQSTAWRTEAERLPPADLSDARDAIRAFGSPELSAVLNQTGLGNHPALVRAFAKALRSNPYRNF